MGLRTVCSPSKGSVGLQWGDEAEANAYVVYRNQISVAGEGNITVGDGTSTWSVVTVTPVLKGDTWYANDTAEDADKSYAYFVVAQNTGSQAASYPSEPTGVDTIEVVKPELDVRTLKDAAYELTDTKVQITWTQGTGTSGLTGVVNTVAANYKLSRAEIAYNTENGIYSEEEEYYIVGDFVNVPLNATQVQQGKAVVTETIGAAASATTATVPLKARTYYLYKLEQIWEGVSSNPDTTVLVEQGAFSKQIKLVLSANTKPEIDPHKKVTLRLTDNGSTYLGDITSIKLFKRDLKNTNPQGGYTTTALTSWTAISKDGILGYADAAVEITSNDARYEYKAVAYNAAGVEIYNSATPEIAAHAAWGNWTYNFNGDGRWKYRADVVRLSDNYVPGTVTLTFKGDFLTGASIKVEYRGKSIKAYEDDGYEFDDVKDTWKLITGTPTIETEEINTFVRPTYSHIYTFPAADMFELGFYYEIRVGDTWTQAPTLDSDHPQSGVIANLRTGYITLGENYVDNSSPSGSKGITLQSNYIKWLGTPEIIVKSTPKDPASTDPDKTYTTPDFTLDGLKAVYAPDPDTDHNGGYFSKERLITIGYADRNNDVQYYITVKNAGYKGEYSSRNNSGGLLNPNNYYGPKYYDSWYSDVNRTTVRTGATVFFGGQYLTNGLTVQYKDDSDSSDTALKTISISYDAKDENYKGVISGFAAAKTYELQWKYDWQDNKSYNSTGTF
jgi:hypothetical protein